MATLVINLKLIFVTIQYNVKDTGIEKEISQLDKYYKKYMEACKYYFHVEIGAYADCIKA